MISVGLQVGILHGTSEEEIKCPVYIVVMTVALPYHDDGATQYLFASRPSLMTVVVGGGGGGMEPTALIAVFDGDIGGLH